MRSISWGMDATIASVQSWELLAQLAAYRQRDALTLDLPALLGRVAIALQRTLPYPWGLLVASEGGTLRATAAWGLDADAQHLLARQHGDLPEGSALLPF